MRTLIIAVILAAAAGLGVALLDSGTGPGPGLSDPAAAKANGAVGRRAVSVRVLAAGTETFREAVEAVGSARARQSVEIVPLAAGRVEEILFEAGDHVAAGQVLVRLDDRQQRASLAEARASLTEAESAFERTKSLIEKKVATQSALEQAEATLARSNAALERAQSNLEDRTVRAPFAGVVGLRQIELGSWIDTDRTIATLDDLDTIEVEFAVPEIFLPRVEAGQEVVARSTAFPGRSFIGEITAIDSRVSPASRAFTVRASIPNEDHVLRAGMFLGIDLVLGERHSVAVPEETLLTSGSETFLYLLEGAEAEKRTVTLGQRHGGMVEVVDGLAPGATVISSGLQTLTNGAPVRVLEGGEGTPTASSGGGAG